MYRIYAIFDVDGIDYRALEPFIHQLPPERQKKAQQFRQSIDKKNCIISYLLLRYGLYKDYDTRSFELSYSSNGKPYLPEHPNIHVSISHCPKGCICAISDAPIGVDIQDVRPFYQPIAEHCCSDAELQFLKQSADPASEFISMWTQKESYLKMQGTGIVDNLDTVDTSKLSGKIITYKMNDCYIAVATAEAFREEKT